jgi:mannan polymerase II complex MNN11 subunit
VVLVTVLDESKYSPAYLETVKENRLLYAERHGMLPTLAPKSNPRTKPNTYITGYKTLFPKPSDYNLDSAPNSWATVVALRDALTKYPECSYVWHIDASGFVMNPTLKIEQHVMKPARLEELMRKDVPVVPPDSIIRTFSHLKAKEVGLVITQDKEGLSTGSLIVRNGEWAKFFLETWFGPLYRSYNFQKAEVHALVSLFFVVLFGVSVNFLLGREGYCANDSALCRNILCNGIRPSSRAWRLLTSGF